MSYVHAPTLLALPSLRLLFRDEDEDDDGRETALDFERRREKIPANRLRGARTDFGRFSRFFFGVGNDAVCLSSVVFFDFCSSAIVVCRTLLQKFCG